MGHKSTNPVIRWAPPAVCLITYPRSGSNYFSEYFYQLTGTHIPKSHDIDYSRGRQIITIVRDPVESMASRKAMFCKTENITNFLEIDIEDYLHFYTNIIPQANIFIDYQKLIDSPKETMSKVLDRLKIPYTMTDYKQTLDKRRGYIISSKDTDMYDSIKTYYEKQDNQELFDIYNKALSLCNI